MTTPASYYLTMSVDVDKGDVGLYLQLYDANHAKVGPCEVRSWSSFCFTWQDLVAWVEAQWQGNGGALNSSLNRPSPFVDLT